jgi:heme/copper-type cytochrome/quinol oxidase subunit 2
MDEKDKYMTPVASVSGGVIFIIIAIVMLWLLIKAFRTQGSQKLFTPQKCLLIAGTVVSVIIAIIFFGAS